MCYARTLIRKMKVDQDRRAEPENRRVKPWTPGRRVLLEQEEFYFDPPRSYEVSYHATKGWRRVRKPAEAA